MSKAEKMRGRLASIQKDREEFEQQRKALEEEMNIGRQNMGKIKKGLKNNEIVNEPILLTESAALSSNDQSKAARPQPIRKDSNNKANGKSNEQNAHLMSPSTAHQENKHHMPLQHTAASSSSSSNDANGASMGPNSAAAVLPSGARVSEWCFTGHIDSHPPIVKSRELYENVRLLGRGSFGEVNLVKNIEDNKLFAIKTIFCAKDADMQTVMHEVKFLRLSRHPCIIDIHDAFLMTNPRVMHIVMHYCESGSISSYISNARKNKNSISEAQIIKWIIQLALALHFMHEVNHNLHRDLKPMNVMLTEGGDLVKLCDFGLALNMDEAVNSGESNDEAGTPYYTAPEMIKGESYSYPADCWSFGIIIHQLLTLERPFEGSNTGTLVRSILSDEPPPVPAHYSEELKAIGHGLLIKNPADRVSMSQLLADPFIYNKASSYPTTYRPRVIEERIRRSHVKTLEYQLERVSRGDKSILNMYKEYKEQQAHAKTASPAPLTIENLSSPVMMVDGGVVTPSGKYRKSIAIPRQNSNSSSGTNQLRLALAKESFSNNEALANAVASVAACFSPTGTASGGQTGDQTTHTTSINKGLRYSGHVRSVEEEGAIKSRDSSCMNLDLLTSRTTSDAHGMSPKHSSISPRGGNNSVGIGYPHPSSSSSSIQKQGSDAEMMLAFGPSPEISPTMEKYRDTNKTVAFSVEGSLGAAAAGGDAQAVSVNKSSSGKSLFLPSATQFDSTETMQQQTSSECSPYSPFNGISGNSNSSSQSQSHTTNASVNTSHTSPADMPVRTSDLNTSVDSSSRTLASQSMQSVLSAVEDDQSNHNNMSFNSTDNEYDADDVTNYRDTSMSVIVEDVNEDVLTNTMSHNNSAHTSVRLSGPNGSILSPTAAALTSTMDSPRNLEDSLDNPHTSSTSSLPGGRKGQQIAKAIETDTYYESKLNDEEENGGDVGI